MRLNGYGFSVARSRGNGYSTKLSNPKVGLPELQIFSEL